MKSLACKTLLLFSACFAFASCVMAQSAAPYSTRPMRVIIPYGPGGGNDIMGRLVADKLRDLLGITTLVENRGGGNGVIGTEMVARSVPDGLTILVTTISSHLLEPLLTKVPYDPVKDFAPIGTIDSSDYVLAINPEVPANSLKEFIALAKEKPGQINYGVSAVAIHLNTALFAEHAGIKIQPIPYKGAGDVMNDLLSGRVQMFMSTPGSMVTHIKSGKLKALAVTSQARMAALPAVPTFAEAGMADFDSRALRFPKAGITDMDIRVLRGVLAARGTPKPFVDRLAAELVKILNMPDTKEKMTAGGNVPLFMTPAQLTASMESTYAGLAKAIKIVDITAER